MFGFKFIVFIENCCIVSDEMEIVFIKFCLLQMSFNGLEKYETVHVAVTIMALICVLCL